MHCAFSRAQVEAKSYRCVNLSNIFIWEKNPTTSHIELETTAVFVSCMYRSQIKNNTLHYSQQSSFYMRSRSSLFEISGSFI